MSSVSQIKESLLHLFFPHVCAGCGMDTLPKTSYLCLQCLNKLPATNYEKYESNPVERIFWGRIDIAFATGHFYFKKESLMQELMHQFKYKRHRELGFQLGAIMGEQLNKAGKGTIDLIIPLPLFPAKERKRGYNQATVLCDGIASILKVPVNKEVVCRPQHTDTQTKKGRIERWKNMEGKFRLLNESAISGKHILLVDDVVTTGATLEACALELKKVPNVTVSIAALCIADH